MPHAEELRATNEQPVHVPNPIRLGWRNVIRSTIREVVLDSTGEPLTIIQKCVADEVPKLDRDDLEAVIIEELQRLHEGVLARYRLRPSDLQAWRDRQR